MGVLAEVRSLTHSVHQSLDDHPLLVQFMSQANQTAYRSFLLAFQNFVQLAQSQIVEFVSEQDRAVLQYQAWESVLIADLGSLNDTGLDLPVHPSWNALLPTIENRSQFWGLLYVLEGSALGGTQVAAAVPKEWPTEFLRRGLRARLRWRYFCKRLGELEMSGELEGGEVVKGAQKAFRSMIYIFDSYLKIPVPRSAQGFNFSTDTSGEKTAGSDRR